jgi:hypothetical protein
MTDRAYLIAFAVAVAIYAIGYALIRRLTAAIVVASAAMCLVACGPTAKARLANATSVAVVGAEPIRAKLQAWVEARESACPGEAESACVDVRPFAACFRPALAACRKPIGDVRAALDAYTQALHLINTGGQGDVAGAVARLLSLANTIAKVVP